MGGELVYRTWERFGELMSDRVYVRVVERRPRGDWEIALIIDGGYGEAMAHEMADYFRREMKPLLEESHMREEYRLIDPRPPASASLPPA